MYKNIISFIIAVNLIFPYFKQDPIMIGLSGAYSTLASGYNTVGVNPANLAFSEGFSINLMNMNINLTNNFLTQSRMQSINGADLENPNSENYYPKDEILGYLDGERIKFFSISKFLMPGINFSKNKFAINSEVKVFSELQLSQDLIDMALNGNQVGREYDLSMINNNIVVLESSFTKAFNLDPVGIGFTIRHLKGLCYYDLQPIQDSFVLTDTTQITSQARYILNQHIYGNGLSFDIGIVTKENNRGWKFGLSFVNLFGDVEWNKKIFFDEPFEAFYDVLPYDEHESHLVNLSIENLSIDVLNNVDLSDIYDIDSESVYEVNTQPNGVEGDHYFCSSDDCHSFYVSSDNYDITELEIVESEIIKQDYPTSMFIGLSKTINQNSSFIVDLSTGLDNSFGNIEKWRLAMGYTINVNRLPLRVGMSYGGYDKKSFSFGSGFHFKKVHLDFGLSFKGAMNFSKTNGIDFGINMNLINL